MAYLNLDLDYFTHPKTVRLIGLLGKDSAVLPIRLWCYVGKYHSTNGRLAGYSPQEIESVVNWWGKQGELVEAMLKVGFLSKTGNDYEIKDWLEHEGHLKMFHDRAKIAAKERWKISNATSIAKREHKQCPSRTIRTKPSVPNLTKPKSKENKNVFDVFIKEKGKSQSRASPSSQQKKEAFETNQKKLSELVSNIPIKEIPK